MAPANDGRRPYSDSRGRGYPDDSNRQRGGGSSSSSQRHDKRDDRDGRPRDSGKPDRPPRDRSRDGDRKDRHLGHGGHSSSGRTPPGPPGPPALPGPPERRHDGKPPSGAGVRPLGGSSSALAEAAKQILQQRQQQLQAGSSSNGNGVGAHDSDPEDGELQGALSPGEAAALGKRKHSPIVWRTPPKSAKTDAEHPLPKVESTTAMGDTQAATSAGTSGVGPETCNGAPGASHLPGGPVTFQVSANQQPADSDDAQPGAQGQSSYEDDDDGSDAPAARKTKSGISSRWLDLDEEEEQQAAAKVGVTQEVEGSPRGLAAEDGGHGPAPAPGTEEGPQEREEGAGGADEEQASEEEEEPEIPLPEPSMLKECRSVELYERLNRISEGAYGVVYRAREKATGRICALKKVKMDKERDGFPMTSIREINILLSLQHPNVVNVSEVVVGESLDSIFMVMEYMEHDLKAMSEEMQQPFSTSEVKCLMLQLLEGVAYMHNNWVIHRDLKTSNLLYNNKGELKICDFGLARQFGSPLRPYTQLVVTLWYRAPELLLGTKSYSTAVDMWSVGCIMAEWLSKKVLFEGKSEMDQTDKIFKTMGKPNEKDWPGLNQLPKMKVLRFQDQPHNRLRDRFPPASGFDFDGKPALSDAGFDLLSGLLTLCPERRLSAKQALAHEWFKERPLPKECVLMPTFPNRSERAAGVVKRCLAPSPDPRIAQP